MRQPFDWTTQPEASGPSTEPRTRGGVALDVGELAAGRVRLPTLDQQALADGDLVPQSAPDPFTDRAMLARERQEAALRYDAGRQAMRELFEGTARGAGADWMTARRSADELLKLAPPPDPLTPAERELMDELLARRAAHEHDAGPDPAAPADAEAVAPADADAGAVAQ